MVVQPRILKNTTFPQLLWIGKNLEIYRAKEKHFKIQIFSLWMNWENLCPNLSFTAENKMGNSCKWQWWHWDITFRNLSMHWEKHFPFSIAENGMNALGIMPISQFGQKALKIYVFLAYVYKSIALVNELKRLKY